MRKINWSSLAAKPYRDWPDRALIVRAKSLHHSCFVVDCSSVNDLVSYDALLAELDRRGYDQVSVIDFQRRNP